MCGCYIFINIASNICQYFHVAVGIIKPYLSICYAHTHTHTHTYIYIYIYVCVCICGRIPTRWTYNTIGITALYYLKLVIFLALIRTVSYTYVSRGGSCDAFYTYRVSYQQIWFKKVHSESWLILEIANAFWILNDLGKHVNIIAITFSKYFSSLKIYNANPFGEDEFVEEIIESFNGHTLTLSGKVLKQSEHVVELTSKKLLSVMKIENNCKLGS